MAQSQLAAERDAAERPPVDRKAVLDRLDRVDDPELDRSIVELEYVDAIEINAGDTSRMDGDGSDAGESNAEGSKVFVRFKLPTAWCSPTFAWMMATGIRDETEELPGVSRATVELIDHMHATEINDGVNAREPFEEAFEDATEGIEETRRSLDRKARLARQYRAVEALLDVGMRPEQIVSLSPADVGLADLLAEGRDVEADIGESSDSDDEAGDRDEAHVTIPVDGGALYVQVPREPIAVYVAKAIDTDLLASPDDVLFATPDGEAISVEDFDLVHHRARAANVNQIGQGGVCASLHEARYGLSVDEPAD
jgi:metal-sulfur cluster biosynthetic enzyme